MLSKHSRFYLIFRLHPRVLAIKPINRGYVRPWSRHFGISSPSRISRRRLFEAGNRDAAAKDAAGCEQPRRARVESSRGKRAT
jgi:hypothetical protein